MHAKIKYPVYGSYINNEDRNASLSDISIDFIVPMELITQWKRCGLVADFIAYYQSIKHRNKKRVESILSTVTNELLENAIKFSSDKNKLVNLSLRQYGSKISIEAINICDIEQAVELDNFISKIVSEDPEVLFYKQIEYAVKHDKASSKLGMITLKKDYNAQIGIKISEKKSASSLYDIYVKVTLDSKELEGE